MSEHRELSTWGNGRQPKRVGEGGAVFYQLSTREMADSQNIRKLKKP